MFRMITSLLILGILCVSGEPQIENIPGDVRIQKLEAKFSNLEMLIYKLETEKEFYFDSDLMLVGETAKSGTVFYRGQFVCDSGWGPEEAQVVCRELGYSMLPDVIFAKRNSHFDQPSQYGLSSWFDCSGSEASLSECRKMTGGRFCSSNNAAGVYCGPSLELRGGSGPHEGNVFFGGAPVCSLDKAGSVGDWTDAGKGKAATVVCRILGYTRAKYAIYGTIAASPFPETTEQSILSGVKCSGAETSVLGCTAEPMSWSERHLHCQSGVYLGKYIAGVKCE